MTLPHHLVTVWNPSYASDAMDEQVRAGTKTHLYLTDYRSLYVAWVGEITAQHLPREQPEELDHMPSYYRDQFADFWFQLWDIRRLVADDTPAVIEELKRLHNTRYHDRPVSLYGGMVELPLIVTREDGASWFSDGDVLTDGRLWAQRESELNALLMPAMRKVLSGKPHSDRSVLLDGRTVDLGVRIPPQSLGTLLVMLEKKPVVQKAVRTAFPHDHAWLLGELPHCLRRITGIRNPAAHTRAATREGVGEGRNEILGIGGGGDCGDGGAGEDEERPMNLQELKSRLRHFAEERDWDQLRTFNGLCPVIYPLYNCDMMQKTTVIFCISLQDRGFRAVSR